MTARHRLDDLAPAPDPTGETRLQRHVRMLTDVRDRLRAAMVVCGLPMEPPEPTALLCRLHGQPWITCSLCSTRSKTQ